MHAKLCTYHISYVYIYIYTHNMYIYIYIHIHIYIYIYICLAICTHARRHTLTCKYAHVRICARTHTAYNLASPQHGGGILCCQRRPHASILSSGCHPTRCEVGPLRWDPCTEVDLFFDVVSASRMPRKPALSSQALLAPWMG